MTPKPSTCSSCAYRKIGQGFARDSGDPRSALLWCLWEAPGAEEVQTQEAATGPTGKFFDYGLLDKVGLARWEVFVHNVIRCRPPGNEYPVGAIKWKAEKACRQYDAESDRNLWVVTFHPASIFRNRQFELYVLRALEFARDRAEEGYKPEVLMGRAAVGLRAPWLLQGAKGELKAWVRHWWASR